MPWQCKVICLGLFASGEQNDCDCCCSAAATALPRLTTTMTRPRLLLLLLLLLLDLLLLLQMTQLLLLLRHTTANTMTTATTTTTVPLLPRAATLTSNVSVCLFLPYGSEIRVVDAAVVVVVVAESLQLIGFRVLLLPLTFVVHLGLEWKPEPTLVAPCTRCNRGALIIRRGFWGPLYYIKLRTPPPPPPNSIGNY